MKLKKGVTLTGIRPELLIAIMVANDVYSYHGYEFVITSVTDGKHSKTSLHYPGFAFDSRIRNIDDDTISVIVEDLRNSLTDEFDVVLEGNHIHIEYQPKR